MRNISAGILGIGGGAAIATTVLASDAGTCTDTNIAGAPATSMADNTAAEMAANTAASMADADTDPGMAANIYDKTAGMISDIANTVADATTPTVTDTAATGTTGIDATAENAIDNPNSEMSACAAAGTTGAIYTVGKILIPIVIVCGIGALAYYSYKLSIASKQTNTSKQLLLIERRLATL